MPGRDHRQFRRGLGQPVEQEAEEVVMIERPAVRPAFLGDPAADPALELRRDADAFDDAPTEDRTVARRSRVERELDARRARSEEHKSELQSLMRNSYAVFC